jgi:hypothetical protein
MSLMLVFVLGASANSLAASKFEIDDPGGTVGANLLANSNCTGGLNCIDWVSIPNTGSPNETRQADLPTGASDDSYKGGSKEDDACPKIETGSIPNNKSDLRNFGSYKEPVAGGPGILHVFWTRVQDPSGTTNMDFEFNKSTVPCGGSDTVNMTRTPGDILLQFDVDNGGQVATLSKRTWLVSGAWSDKTALTATVAIGSINQATIAAADADSLGALSARTFGEASFDLASVFDATRCASFGSAMLKSRSSDSFTSALKDFIKPIPLNIQNCATVIIRKVTDPVTDTTTSFGYHETFDTDPAQAAPGNVFSLTGGSSMTANNVLFGTGLTVSEDAPPTDWAFVSLDCAVAAHPSSGVTPVIGGTGGRQVTFSLDAATDVLDCTYTNRKQLGSVKVVKRSIKQSGGVGVPLANAQFSVTGPNSFSQTLTTGADGTACVDHLAFGTYVVTETVAPTGYTIDNPASSNVVVDSNSDCTTVGAGDTVSRTDTPLTNITATADSQDDGPGGTLTTITCLNSGNANVGNSPSGNVHNPSVAANNLAPGTYTCTLVIDP